MTVLRSLERLTNCTSPKRGPIRTDADYRAALALVAPYFDNEPEIDSDAGAHIEAMVTLIEAYETKHYPMSPPDPIEASLSPTV